MTRVPEVHGADLVGLDPWQSEGFITYTYLTGGTYFTVGACALPSSN